MNKKIIVLSLIVYLGIACISMPICAQEPMTWEALDQQVIMLYNEGNLDYAAAMGRKAQKAAEDTLGPGHPSVATVLNNLATVYYAQGLYDAAEPLYKRSLAIKQRALGTNHLDVAQGMNNLATLYYAKGLYEDAEPLYRRALDIREQALGSDHPDVAKSLHNLGVVYSAQALNTSIKVTKKHSPTTTLKEPVQSNTIKKPPAVKEKRQPPLIEPKKELLPETPSINADQLYTRITKGHDIILLDIRPKSEQVKKYIPNSIRFPRANISKNEEDLKNILRNTNRGATIAIFSSDMDDIGDVITKLRSWGYRAYSMDGGFAYWEEQGYPIQD